MKEKINIAEILKDKPQGTKLYSLTYGDCFYQEYTGDFGIECQSQNGVQFNLDEYGRYCIEGECILFPSKEMRDWSKFFKKGDVLVCYEGKKPYYTVFDCFESNTYKDFKGKFAYDSYEDKCYQNEGNLSTNTFHKLSIADSEIYITKIEERFGGKLNLETMEIEKPAKPTFEIGKLYVFKEEDEDGELTIIGKLIAKNESEDKLTFGNQYEIETENFVTDQAFDLRISIHEELREATEGEAITFQETYTIWEKSKKQSAFKPFDKVLCRDDIGKEWHIDLFESVLTDNSEYNYKCMVNVWKICIPYEGNEHLLGTTKDVEG